MGMEMRENGVRPDGWIAGCAAAHRRLERLLGGLTDEMVLRPTALEGWSVGHILTHLARNADSHGGMVEAAQRGEVVAQYPGGAQQRGGDIERGHDRLASVLVADLEAAQHALERAWSETTNEVWATGLGKRTAGLTALGDLVVLRWREVEVHHVDLGLGELGPSSWDDLDGEYVDVEWQLRLAELGRRVPDGLTVLLVPGDRPSAAAGTGPEVRIVRGSAGRLLGWQFGRGGEASWPALGMWT
jgi:maleylpyruvate isomerase